MNDQSPPILTAEHPTDENEEVASRSLTGDIKQLAEDARTLAEAEMAFQKARTSYAGAQVPRIAVAGIAAFVFFFLALMALVVGTIISLAPLIGGWAAMALVTGVLLVIAVIFALVARSRVGELKRVAGSGSSSRDDGFLEDESTAAFEESGA